MTGFTIRIHNATVISMDRHRRILRDAVIGKNWLPGAQKYAYGATALGLVDASDASVSVKELLNRMGKMEKAPASKAEANEPVVGSSKIGGAACGKVFN